MSINPIFTRRARGEAAVAVGGRTGPPEAAARAVLQTTDGDVLVYAIRRIWEGMYAAKVYACVPGQRGVKVGDTVAFEEAQVFRYVIEREEDVTAVDMASRFVFEPDEEHVNPEVWALHSAVDRAQSPPTAAPVAAAAAAIVLDEAMELLGDEPEVVSRELEDGESESREERPVEPVRESDGRKETPVEPQRESESREAKPVEADRESDRREETPVEPQRESESREAKPVVPEPVRKCAECGSVLPKPQAVAAPDQPTAPRKVSCPICGRINSIQGA